MSNNAHDSMHSVAFETFGITTLSEWRVASREFVAAPDLKRFVIHSTVVGILIFIAGLIISLTTVGYALAGSMLLISVPFCLAAPLAAKLFRTTNYRLMWTVSILVIIFCAVISFIVSVTILKEYAFLRDGFPEELAKMVSYLIPVWSGVIKDSYTLVFAAFVAGFIFGEVENIYYCLMGAAGILSSDSAYIAMLRYIGSPMAHASFTMIGAIMIAYVKSAILPRWSAWIVYPLTLCVPALIHGSFNYCVYLGSMEWCCAIDILAIAAPFVMMIPLRRKCRTQAVIIIDQIPQIVKQTTNDV